jgi:hypothetical protein
MTDRREFLQAAAVLTTAPIAGHAFGGTGAGSAARLDAVVVDTRHAAARDFGSFAELAGAPRRDVQGDITELWQKELAPRWRESPAALAGLTERPALFLLERLAWDNGLRVVFEAEHLPDGKGGMQHRIVQSADATLAHELAAAGADWPAVLADALIAGSRAATRNALPSGAAMAAHLAEPVKLYSWIIAPRKPA